MNVTTTTFPLVNKKLISLCIALLMAGCGGGGSGDSDVATIEVEGGQTQDATGDQGDNPQLDQGNNTHSGQGNDTHGATIVAPAALQVISSSRDAITLSWQDPQPAQVVGGYDVYRDDLLIASVDSTLFAYTVTGLAAGQQYQFSVRAYDQNGQRSAPVSINASPRENAAPRFDQEPGQQWIANTLGTNDLITRFSATDADGDALQFRIASGNEAQRFVLDAASGELRVNGSLLDQGNKVFNLRVEVSDGFSVTSAQLQLGVVAINAQASDQGLLRQVYQYSGISGTLDTLYNHSQYPGKPSSTSVESSFMAPSDAGNYYGQRMLGYLVPPTTGEYTFWMASDDQGELYLGENLDGTDAKRIASVDTYSSPQQWTKFSNQKSVAITLQAGKPYYISAVMSEGSGGDHLSVAWQGPGIAQQVIPGTYLRQPVDMTPPAAPRELNAVLTGDADVLLEWKAATDDRGVVECRVYNGSTLLGSAGIDAETGAVQTSVQLTNLISAKRYDFTVRAVDAAGNVSAASQPRTVIMDDIIAPTAPTGLQSLSVTSSQIRFNWAASTDETNSAVLYRIYLNDKKVGSTHATEFTVSSLTADTDFTLVVEAVDVVGNSTRSDALSVHTAAIDASQPRFAHASYSVAVVTSATVGSVIGQFSAIDPQSKTLSYRIVSGNDSANFSVDASGKLTLAKSFAASQPTQLQLTLQASNGTQSVQTTVLVNVLTAATLANKGIYRELWTGVSGSTIADINLTLNPAQQDLVANFETPSAMGDSYGQRLRGYLIPPTTGAYTFWMASDDAGELYLSTDMSAEKKELVSKISTYTSIRNWQTSSLVKTSVTLQAGQMYYIEALHKEGSGGDHMAVGWQGPGISKQLLAGNYVLPYSSLTPPAPIVSNGIQSGFDQQGSQIQVTLNISELAAGLPVRIYYGLRDGGSNAGEWQSMLSVGNLAAGTHTVTLDGIAAGQTYYIRVESVGATGSTWSGGALEVSTVVVPEDKHAGHSLPETLSLQVDVNGVIKNVELSKHSVRSPNFALITYDDRRQQQFEAVSPMPEVRTYRGHITNDPYVVVTGVVNAEGTLYLTGWENQGQSWTRNISIADQVDTDALGNSEIDTEELIVDFAIPATEGNQLYVPQPGNDFHNNLARAYIHFHNGQLNSKAGGNLINAVAMMEGHLNELDYVWAQKTGLRWDLGYGLIEMHGSTDTATDPRPGPKDSTNFAIEFQDPRNGGYCWGGGDWVGCEAWYRLNWGFTHEIGHNFGLGHWEQEDNANQLQQPGTQMGNMQSRSTLVRLQSGSKFKAAKAIEAPMPPAAFKDYVTVYRNESVSVAPLANDYDANGETLSIVSFDATTAAGGVVTQSGNTLRYTPPTGFVGNDQLTYTVSDGTNQSVGAIQIQVQLADLVGKWDMESVDGETVLDTSGQNNHLYGYGSAVADSQTSGISGYGMALPLIASKVGAKDALGHNLLPHTLEPGHKSFTASIWFQYSGITGNKLIMGKSSSSANYMSYGGWEIRTEGDDLVMQINYRNRLLKSNAVAIRQNDSIIDGNWHHAVIVVDQENGELRGYLDGQAFTTQGTLLAEGGPILAAMNFTSYGGGSPFKVGGHVQAVCDAEGANCAIPAGQAYDNVRVYHRALSETEVETLFQE